MQTRKEYMDTLPAYVPGQVSDHHRRYWAQFVTQGALEIVRKTIGLDRLRASTDPYLNDIELAVWDRMAGGSGRANQGDSKVYHVPNYMPYSKIKEAGEGYSLGTGVCILKEAARQLIEEESEQ